MVAGWKPRSTGSVPVVLSVGSPPPTSTIRPGVAPATTVVSKRAAGPSTCNAAVAAASLPVEAGATGTAAPRS